MHPLSWSFGLETGGIVSDPSNMKQSELNSVGNVYVLEWMTK